MKFDKDYLIKLLDKIESQIPEHSSCPDGCCKCCGPVQMIGIEAERIGIDRLYTRTRGEVNGTGNDDTCEFVHPETGKCTIYEKRPFMCRFFNGPFAGRFKCQETPRSGEIRPVDADRILGQYFYLVEHSGDLKAYMEACDLCYATMKSRERRFGWDDRMIEPVEFHP